MQYQTFKKGSRVSEPFVVMAKPVGPLCNLECSYCYYLETGRLYDNTHQFRMSERLLETYIRLYIAASPGPVIQFTWHGGEPTLAGLDFYWQVVELQKRYLPEGWSCWNNLQTNGLLLDDDLLAVLELGDVLHRDDDLVDPVLHAHRHRPAVQVRLHLVLIAGVGVHHVPASRLVVGADDEGLLVVVPVVVGLGGLAQRGRRPDT